MADDIANDVSTEITLDDFNADEQQPAKAEPSPAPKDEKVEKPAPVDKAEAKEDKASESDDTPAAPDIPLKTETDSQQADETDTANKPTKAEDRKTQLNSEIRDLVAQRNTLREEVEKANSEVYQPASVDDLKEQGMTELEAKVESMRQQGEMDKYNNQVAEAQLTIGHESQRILNDFAWSDPDSPDYKKELAIEAAELLQSNLIIDPNTNQVIGSNVSPYQLYKTLDRATNLSTIEGQIKGQADTEKQLASVDAASNAAPPQKKSDPLMDLWTSDD